MSLKFGSKKPRKKIVVDVDGGNDDGDDGAGDVPKVLAKPSVAVRASFD
jgi:hypothetical protein